MKRQDEGAIIFL